MKKLLVGCILVFTISSAAFAGAMNDWDFVKFCQTGTLAEIKEVLKSGANVNASERYGDRNSRMKGHTPLISALLSGVVVFGAIAGETKKGMELLPPNPEKAEIVKLLIASGANVNEKIGDEVSPLHIAIICDMQDKEQKYELSQTLISAEADVNAATSTRNLGRVITPLMMAMGGIDSGIAGAERLVAMLLDAGVDATMEDHQGYKAISYLKYRMKGDNSPYENFSKTETYARLEKMSYDPTGHGEKTREAMGKEYDSEDEGSMVIDTIATEISGSFGRNVDEIIKKLGEPNSHTVQKVDNPHNPKTPMIFETLVYDGIEIRVLDLKDKDNRVFIDGLKFSSPKYEINGIKIGDTPEKFMSKLPVPSKQTPELIRYVTSYTTMDIELNNSGKIASITVNTYLD